MKNNNKKTLPKLGKNESSLSMEKCRNLFILEIKLVPTNYDKPQSRLCICVQLYTIDKHIILIIY